MSIDDSVSIISERGDEFTQRWPGRNFVIMSGLINGIPFSNYLSTGIHKALPNATPSKEEWEKFSTHWKDRVDYKSAKLVGALGSYSAIAALAYKIFI